MQSDTLADQIENNLNAVLILYKKIAYFWIVIYFKDSLVIKSIFNNSIKYSY